MCVDISLSVCPRAYLKNSMPKLNEIICTCYAWLWLDAPLTTMRCSALCISGLVDDFTLWHLGVGSIDVGAVLQQQIYQLRTWGEVCWQFSLFL